MKKKQEEALYWSAAVASLTSLHCRCPLAPSINRSAQRMRAQLATNQAEDRIVDHRGGEKQPRSRVDICGKLEPDGCWVRYWSTPASVASCRRIVTLTTCDYPPQTVRSRAASSQASAAEYKSASGYGFQSKSRDVCVRECSTGILISNVTFLL